MGKGMVIWKKNYKKHKGIREERVNYTKEKQLSLVMRLQQTSKVCWKYDSPQKALSFRILLLSSQAKTDDSSIFKR